MAARVAAKTLIEPHLEEFGTRFSALGLEPVMDDSLPNIVADGCDVGIRIGESLAPHMIAVSITPSLERAVVGTPAYFRGHGVHATPADQRRHSSVHRTTRVSSVA
ncbi:hypothetical protein PPH94_035445 [Burkholderia cepacia]|uniref:hypothetical protein n=1 Tax=Burkholderia cepacia TaxID=292 RepID=UPI00234B20D6|nr:hypothetical protein [Burkholderia cepacia]MDC6098755.1 hypothetical protein [Burkholderia cepacia]